MEMLFTIMYARPHLGYGDVIYHNQRAELMDLIKCIQYKEAFCSGCWHGTIVRKNCTKNLVGNRCLTEDGLVAYQYIIKSIRVYPRPPPPPPLYLSDRVPKRNLRNRNDNTSLIRTERYENSFFPYTIKAWKVLEDEAKSLPSIQTFKSAIHAPHFLLPF